MVKPHAYSMLIGGPIPSPPIVDKTMDITFHIDVFDFLIGFLIGTMFGGATSYMLWLYHDDKEKELSDYLK